MQKDSFQKVFTNFSLVPKKLKEILQEVKSAIQITHLDYDVVIKRLHFYYNMKLVTFGINEERNLIIPFPFLYNHVYNNSSYYIKFIIDLNI